MPNSRQRHFARTRVRATSLDIASFPNVSSAAKRISPAPTSELTARPTRRRRWASPIDRDRGCTWPSCRRTLGQGECVVVTEVETLVGLGHRLDGRLVDGLEVGLTLTGVCQVRAYWCHWTLGWTPLAMSAVQDLSRSRASSRFGTSVALPSRGRRGRRERRTSRVR